MAVDFKFLGKYNSNVKKNSFLLTIILLKIIVNFKCNCVMTLMQVYFIDE